MARWLFLLTLLPGPAYAQYTLYASMSITKEYVVGAKLPPQRIVPQRFRWLLGTRGIQSSVYLLGSITTRADPETCSISRLGNGLFRASEGGRKWTIANRQRCKRVAWTWRLIRNAPGTIYFRVKSHGIRVSHDSGVTWKEIGAGLHRKYTEALRVDRSRSGVLMAGGEEGIFRSQDGGETWTIAGAEGLPDILRIEQSPHEPCL